MRTARASILGAIPLTALLALATSPTADYEVIRSDSEPLRSAFNADVGKDDPYIEMLDLAGPCAGVFLVFGPDARWEDDGPPRPARVEDAHAKQYDRPHPQFDSRRLAERALKTLGRYR